MLKTSLIFGQVRIPFIVIVWIGMIFLPGCLLIDFYNNLPVEDKPIEVEDPPTNFWTAKEAYQHVRPHIQAWHEDSVVLTVTAIDADDPEWKVRADGEGPWWYFSIYSPSAQVESAISLLDDVIVVGREGLPGREKPRTISGYVVNLDSLIDTDAAMRIAYQSGVDDGYSPEVLRWDTHHGQPGTFSWNIGFWRGEILEKSPRIIIDAKTGEVIRNDFLDQAE